MTTTVTHVSRLVRFMVVAAVLASAPYELFGRAAQQPLARANAAGTALILGRVLDADLQKPLDAAIVGLYSSTGTLVDQVRTTASGEFVFRNLAGGTWSIGAVKPGFLGSGSGGGRVTVALGDGGRVPDVVVPLRKFSAIGGTILDELGEPLVGLTVQTLRNNTLGQWQFGATARTDDRGVYRISNLTPGAYEVAVISTVAAVPTSTLDAITRTGGPSADLRSQLASIGATAVDRGTADAMQVGGDVIAIGRASKPPSQSVDGHLVVYPTQFYPAATTPANARIIVLKGGEERSTIDLRLMPVPAVRVTGVVSAPAGITTGNLALHLVPVDPAGLSSEVDVASTVTDSTGAFTFPAVPSGQYVIRMVKAPPTAVAAGATAQVETGSETVAIAGAVATPPSTSVPAGETLWAATPVAVATDDVTNLMVTIRTGFRISGRAEFDGMATPPTADQLQRAIIQFRPSDGRVGPFLPGRIGADGRFTTPELPPGRYIAAVAAAASWRLRSAMLEGRDIADVPLDLTDQSLDGVVLTFSDRLPTLAGTVRDAAGAPTPAATVVLFPTDRRLWTDAGMLPRRQRTARTTPKGAYEITFVAAGEYFVAALRDDLSDGWSDPATLQVLAGSAPRVTLAEGTPVSRDLQLVTALPIRAALATTAGSMLSSRLVVSDRPSGGDAPLSGPSADDSSSVGTQTPRDRPVAPATPSGSGAIVGTIVTDDPTARQIHGATIMLKSADGAIAETTFSDEQGRFAFGNLPPGAFHLSASKPAYLPVEYGAKRVGRPGVSISIADGQRAIVSMKMPHGGAITGTVTDAKGAPLPSVYVRVLTRRSGKGGDVSLVTAPGSTPVDVETDERGLYRVYGLSPGEYFVGVTAGIGGAGFAGREITDAEIASAAHPGVSASTPVDRVDSRTTVYGPTFYPSANSLASATPVALQSGEERAGVDVRVNLVPASGLKGAVVMPDGRPAGAARVLLVPAGPYIPTSMNSAGNASSGEVGGLGGLINLTTSAEGAFVIRPSLTPGSYTLLARGMEPGSRALTLWAMTILTIGDHDISGVVIALQPGLTMTGHAAADTDAAPLPTSLARARVSLVNAQTNELAVSAPPGTIDGSGHFTFAGLIPGQYWLSATGLPAPWALKSAMVGGRDVLDRPIDVQPDANLSDVTLVLSDRPSELSGTLLDNAGVSAPDYFVVVFSADKKDWLPKSRRIQAVRPRTDGHYTFTNLPAGEYRLAVVTDVEPNEWYDASFLETLAASSPIALTLADGERKTQDLKIR
jgi:hypothetical protein